MTIYVETSAAGKLLIDEPESDALTVYLDELADDEVYPVSSLLLETEMRRLAHRRDIRQADVSEILLRINLLEPDRGIYLDAGLIAGASLRSLDAIHIASAIRAGAAEMVTYDHRQAESAREAGLQIVAPR